MIKFTSILEYKRELEEFNKDMSRTSKFIDRAALAGIVGGVVGLTANGVICRKRFPTTVLRKKHKKTYMNCLKNPFTRSSRYASRKKSEDKK